MSGPAYIPMRVVVPVAHKLGFPREFCPVCAAKWMKQLWVGSCVCSGDVVLGGDMPGGAHVMIFAPPLVVVAPAPVVKPVRKVPAKPKPKVAAADGLF